MSIMLPDELSELKALPQWVAFRLVMNEEKGKPDKKPLNPKTGRGAKANDAATWATYDEAVAFAERKGLFADGAGGIGFEFANGIAGVDLDNVIQPDGTLTAYAQEVVDLMDSYTELSPSGKGLHILFRMTGGMSDIGARRKNDGLGIEAYSEGRFFTVTGRVYGAVRPIAERTEAMKRVYERYLAKSEKPEGALSPKPNSLSPSVVTRTVDTVGGGMTPQGKYVPSGELSDDELWERMFASESGNKIRALHDGDISGYTSVHKDGKEYPNPSGADIAMCEYLCYWTGNDAGRVDSMFRQTALMRAKWDERHGARTYGELTIDKAIELTPVYVPSMNFVSRKEGGMGAQENTPHKLIMEDYIATEEKVQGEAVYVAESWQPPMTGFDYVDSGAFQADLVQFQQSPEVHTGFENLDKAQGGIYPGLYVLGATPSLGKTTFLVQLSDNFAKAGNFVLYFSLEQSRLELTTKSISRLTAQRDIKNAVSAINIRRGHYVSEAQREAVKKAVADYQTFSNSIAIVELGLDATIGTITDTVKRLMDSMFVRPVIVVDYLQIVRPDNEKLSTKDAVDTAVKTLKKLQVDNNLIIWVISSLNRTNYLAPVDYESFKETGGIEYTADCLFGLQPQVMTDKLFDADKKTVEKREAVDKALASIPRKVMLKNLKNRFGQKGYACGFNYDCRFDLFMPDMSFKEHGDD